MGATPKQARSGGGSEGVSRKASKRKADSARMSRDDSGGPATKADMRDLKADIRAMEKQIEWLSTLFTEKFSGMEKYMNAKFESVRKDTSWLKWFACIDRALLVGLLLILGAR